MDGGGDDTELGERVPNLNMDFFSGIYAHGETYAEEYMLQLEEKLGLNISANPRDTTALVKELYEDPRNTLIPLYTYAVEPDPHFTTRRNMAHQAGGGIGATGQNVMQWANCDYSVRADEQAFAVDRDERQRLISEAWSILSHECAMIPVSSMLRSDAFRNDRVNLLADTEDLALMTFHYPHLTDTYFKVEPVDKDRPMRITGTTSGPFDIRNPFLHISQAHWSNQFTHSPFTRYDENDEIYNDLARSIETEEGGTRVIVEMKNDATFHNGDPVTAEDAKFTWDYMAAGSAAGHHTFTPELPVLEEIGIVDDNTIEFVMEKPFAPLVFREFPTWGIHQKASWMEQLSEYGVESFDSHETDFDRFSDVYVPPEEINGSGPWQLDLYRRGERVGFAGWPDHHTFSIDWDFEYIRNLEPPSRLASIQAGEVDVASIGPGQAERIQDNENITVNYYERIQHILWMAPNGAAAPTKFKEFRQAMAAVLNRQEMVQLAFRGRVDPELYSILYTQTHPWRPDEEMLYQMAPDATGSTELGRAFLEQAGWGWDDDGRLRYPADADLEPLFPAESHASPEDFPCINEDGYQFPDGYEMSDDQVPGYQMESYEPWPEEFHP